ncbi:hypothetical protein MNBD_GAMMA20-564, partial [hydrothermal vent metagenome]
MLNFSNQKVMRQDSIPVILEYDEEVSGKAV